MQLGGALSEGRSAPSDPWLGSGLPAHGPGAGGAGIGRHRSRGLSVTCAQPRQVAGSFGLAVPGQGPPPGRLSVGGSSLCLALRNVTGGWCGLSVPLTHRECVCGQSHVEYVCVVTGTGERWGVTVLGPIAAARSPGSPKQEDEVETGAGKVVVVPEDILCQGG